MYKFVSYANKQLNEWVLITLTCWHEQACKDWKEGVPEYKIYMTMFQLSSYLNTVWSQLVLINDFLLCYSPSGWLVSQVNVYEHSLMSTITHISPTILSWHLHANPWWLLMTEVFVPSQTIAVLCDRNALEVHRYGHPMKFPDTPKLQLIQALCGRGE